MNKEKTFYFSVVEEAILNENFNKKYPNYRAGRIEVWHKDYPYDVDEIRLLLPVEMFVKIRDILDFQDVDCFQIGNCNSENIEEDLIKRKIIKK